MTTQRLFKATYLVLAQRDVCSVIVIVAHRRRTHVLHLHPKCVNETMHPARPRAQGDICEREPERRLNTHACGLFRCLASNSEWPRPHLQLGDLSHPRVVAWDVMCQSVRSSSAMPHKLGESSGGPQAPYRVTLGKTLSNIQRASTMKRNVAKWHYDISSTRPKYFPRYGVVVRIVLHSWMGLVAYTHTHRL